MTIISSQQYLDYDVVGSKIEELRGQEKVTIACDYIGEIDGEEYAVQKDGHHTLAAARELGLEVKFSIGKDAEGLMGEQYLEARYNDGDWYKVETSNPYNNKFDLVW